jgi:hypothetical protein
MPLEILHVTLVLFGRRARLESAEVAAFAGPGVDFPGIKPVLTGSQFADHGGSSPMLCQTKLRRREAVPDWCRKARNAHAIISPTNEVERV